MNREIFCQKVQITESKFITYVDNVYIQLCLAITMKEIEKVKHFVAEEIYDRIAQQLSILQENHLIHMYDELTVKETKLLDFRETEEEYQILVHITSLYLDYYLDEDGNYVRGNRENRIQKENDLLFCKRKDAKEVSNIHRCPGCGNSIDVNGNGMCDYCGTTYDIEHTGWLLISWEVS